MKNRRGISLIEIILAIVIIGIMALAGLQFFIHCANLIQHQKAPLVAAYIAAEYMEYVTVEPLFYDWFTIGQEDGKIELFPGGIATWLKTTYSGARTLTVDKKSGYKTVAVKVSWTD